MAKMAKFEYYVNTSSPPFGTDENKRLCKSAASEINKQKDEEEEKNNFVKWKRIQVWGPHSLFIIHNIIYNYWSAHGT